MDCNEFLEYSGKLYEVNRRKWSVRLSKLGYKFSDDIYNDTILKIYDSLERKPYDGVDIDGYWYQSFLNNTKRDTKYSYHKRDDSIDVYKYLDEIPYEEPSVYASMFPVLMNREEDVDFHLFRMYYLCPDLTYEEIESLTGMKSVRSRIKRIRDKMNVESYSYRDI